MDFQKKYKKLRRNITDYGFYVTAKKIFTYLICLLYDKKAYRIYVVNLEKQKGMPIDDDYFLFKLINENDADVIRQIEGIEEWLHGRLKVKLENGALCLAAMDGSMLAGFNLVSLKEAELPLVHFKKIMRSGNAWSEQITVTNDYRGRRLASVLRMKMFYLLKQRGIRKFYGGAQPSNIASLKLARSVGFVEIADIQYRKIFTNESVRCRRYRA